MFINTFSRGQTTTPAASLECVYTCNRRGGGAVTTILVCPHKTQWRTQNF